MIEIDDDSSISILKLNRHFEAFFIGSVCPSVGNVKWYTKIFGIHNLGITTDQIFPFGQRIKIYAGIFVCCFIEERSQFIDCLGIRFGGRKVIISSFIKKIIPEIIVCTRQYIIKKSGI